MSAKTTIAMVGASEKLGAEFAGRLVKNNYRILLVTNDNAQARRIFKQLNIDNPHAEVEFIDCAREGCWEADIIILAIPPEAISETAEKIKEVSTQKVVLIISNNVQSNSSPFATAQDLQKLLPYSRVVAAFKYPGSNETFVAGDNHEAVEIISGILKQTGYSPSFAESLSAIKAL